VARITTEIRHEITLENLLREIHTKAGIEHQKAHQRFNSSHMDVNPAYAFDEIRMKAWNAFEELRRAQALRDRPWWKKLFQ
jgi:hypothetical protein